MGHNQETGSQFMNYQCSETTHNQALQLTVKRAAPIVALLFTASELGRYTLKDEKH